MLVSDMSGRTIREGRTDEGSAGVGWLERMKPLFATNLEKLQGWIERVLVQAGTVIDVAVETTGRVVAAEPILVPVGLGFLVESAIPVLRGLLVAQFLVVLALELRHRGRPRVFLALRGSDGYFP